VLFRVIAGALSAILVASISASPASAEEPPPIPPPTLDDDVLQAPPELETVPSDSISVGVCTDDLAELKELAAAGQETVICQEEVYPPSREVQAMLRDEGAGIAEILPLPETCAQFFGLWVINRHYQCRMSEHLLRVTDTRGGLLGTIQFVQMAYLYTSDSIATWAFQFEILPTVITGLAAGSTAVAFANCSGACNVTNEIFTPRPVLVDVSIPGESYHTTTVPGSGPIGSGVSTWLLWFENPLWETGMSTPGDIIPARNVRCDEVTPGNPWVGCIVTVEPRHLVSLSGPTPELARHLTHAQAYGLPGFVGSGEPLRRLTDQTLRQRNGDTACPSSFPRPAGYSCDEYPFRSTWEGAFTGGGPGGTFSFCQITDLPLKGLNEGGYTACMINAEQNSLGGSMLQTFYSRNRVIEGDWFYVGVTL
jgi:hypothetical protein